MTAKLSDAFKQVMTNPDIRSRMVAQGADPAFMGSEEFGQFLAAEMPHWATAVKASGAGWTRAQFAIVTCKGNLP